MIWFWNFLKTTCNHLYINLIISVNGENQSKSFPFQHSAVYRVDHKSLFEFVNHAASIERWLQSVSHYKSEDRQRPDVGKRYRTFFQIPYLLRL